MNNTERKIVGYFLLIPSIVSVFAFILQGLSQDKNLYQFTDFSRAWLGDYYGSGGGASSMLPVYFGLMAIAGAYLIKDPK